jgi:hypothetical protein
LIAGAARGVYEVHYALVIIRAMGIRLFAQPFGVACAAQSAKSSAGRLMPVDRIGSSHPIVRLRCRTEAEFETADERR